MTVHHQSVPHRSFHNVRIGGPFFDFELLSEYCAINLLLLQREMHRRLVFAPAAVTPAL